MPETANEEKKGEEGATAAPIKEWRSVVLTGFGGLKMLKVQKKPESKPEENQVLIRVKAWYVTILYTLIFILVGITYCMFGFNK